MHDTFTVEIPKLFSKELYRKILIGKEGVTIETAQNESPIFIAADELIAFRYGMKGINGYAFTIGRHYFIEIKTIQQKSIVIKFNSYYRFRRRIYWKTWVNIVDELWNYHFVNHYLNHHDKYKNGEYFEFNGISFQGDGISWDNKNILLFTQIGLGNYVNYFMVYNKQNKSQQKSYNFMHDWNALVLQELLKVIVKEHQSTVNGATSNTHP